MNKYIYLGLGIIISLTTSEIVAQQSYEEWVRQNSSQYQQFREAMISGVAADTNEFAAFKELYEQEFEAFKDDIENKWGSFKARSKKEWVEYLNDGSTRIDVNFETGEGLVSIISDTPIDLNNNAELIRNQFLAAINTNGTELGFESSLPNPLLSSTEPLLNNQVAFNDNDENEEAVEAVIAEGIESTEVIGEDGVQRFIIMIDFDLVPDHIERRARKISEIIYNYSVEYSLDPPLVFAIIHTESFFNPVAVSPANAYGLMQLVPTSGGRDAYRAVYGKDGIPTDSFLFDPGNNINLGCAYVDILLTRYFKDVSSPLTKMYLAISAYNTGAGNVYRAYDPEKRSKSAAMRKISTLDDQQNYEYLVANLPYEETRNYLKKVVDRSRLYQEWSEK